VAGLPDDLPAAVFVVLHVSPNSPGVLPDILNSLGRLPANHALEDEPIRRGRIYVAPPDHHLVIHRDGVRLTRGPRENRFRPAIDPLFRTAARAFGSRVVGVLLSGGLNDGTYGMMVVKQEGGVVVIQDPEEAEVPGIVRSALENVAIDHVLPSAQMAPVLTRLVLEPVAHAMRRAETPTDPSESENLGLPRRPPGDLAPLVCPECGGSLWEKHHGSLIRYECHEGHAFTGESLLSEQTDAIENALWSALRALDENAELFRRMANNARKLGRLKSSAMFEENAREAAERGELIRRVLLRRDAG
jgi:two-component system chemotaxis response regulator CheB